MSKTILVTRAKGDEHELTEALQALGHAVIHEPLTEIFLDHTIRGHLYQMLLAEPNAILITSKHAVQALALLSDIRDVMLLCVGESTAEMAQSLGFVRVEIAGGTVEHLLNYIRDAYDEESKFLYVSGEHIRSDLPVILETFGMHCERIIAYQAIGAEGLSDTLVEQMKRGQIDAVTFFSPRNAEIFCNLLEQTECARTSRKMDAFCLSDDVAASADKLDWRAIMIAEKPTLASLVESIDNAY